MKKQTFIIVIGILLFIQPLNAQTWTATMRLTWNSGDSFLPDIAVDSNNHIHVVWEDETPGNKEIYYKKGIQYIINIPFILRTSYPMMFIWFCRWI